MNNKTYEIYCNYNLTNLLIKLGFDWQDYFVAHSIDEHFHWEIPLHIAQKWLRDVKGYIILINYNEFLKTFYYSICYTKNTNRYIDDKDDCRNTSFEEAQKAGIKKALKLLLEKGE